MKIHLSFQIGGVQSKYLLGCCVARPRLFSLPLEGVAEDREAGWRQGETSPL